MTGFFTEIEIQADVTTVWQVLADTKSYPSWNPLIYRIEGELQIGSTPKFYVNMPFGVKTHFRATILKVLPSRELRWFGRLLGVNFLLTGEHFFILEPTEVGTRLIHGEKLNGVVSPIFLRILGGQLYRNYIDFNRALKKHCENMYG